MGLATVTAIPDDTLERAADSLLNEHADRFAAACSYRPRTHSLGGDAGKVITDLAKSIDADLIVCGSKGHSDIAGIFLGSVSHKICHLAPCACMVVR